jgi:integrase
MNNDMSASLTETDKSKQIETPNKPKDTANALIVSKKISKGDKYFPEAFVKQLYLMCDDIRDKTYLMYHIETGLRVSDVINTEMVHIDWNLCRTYTYDHKKDQWRHVYFPEFVKAQLKQWYMQRQALDIKDERLFPFSEKTANRIIKNWAKKLNFNFASLVGSHWCRHTFIRLSRKAGRDIKAVQQNTGDTIKTLLEWYSDLSQEDMRQEISKPLTRI